MSRLPHLPRERWLQTSAAVSSTASSSSSAGDNGLKLSKTGRSLPFSLESHILDFCAADELAALLHVSHDMEALLCNHFRGISTLQLTFSETSHPGMRRQLMRALTVHTRRLQRISIGGDADLLADVIWSPSLMNLVAGNRSTLRAMTIDKDCWRLGWSAKDVFTLATCPELREFCATRLSGRKTAYGAAEEFNRALQVLFRASRKLERVALPLWGEDIPDETIRSLLAASLPLASADFTFTSPSAIAQLGSNHRLTALNLYLQSNIYSWPTIAKALGDQLKLLPKLQEFKLATERSIDYEWTGAQDVKDIVWDLPACTSLDLRTDMRAPTVRTPLLSSFQAESWPNTSSIVQILQQAPPLRSCRLYRVDDRAGFFDVFKSAVKRRRLTTLSL